MRVAVNKRPSVQKVVVQLLAEDMGLPVSTKVPKKRPAKFLTVQRIGGGMQNPVTDRAVMAIQAWAGDDITAEQLCFDAEAVLFAAVGVTHHGAMIRHCKEATAPLSFPDESEQVRYQVLVEIDLAVH